MSGIIRKKYCVNGVWKESKTQEWMQVTDSSTGEVIAEVAIRSIFATGSKRASTGAQRSTAPYCAPAVEIP